MALSLLDSCTLDLLWNINNLGTVLLLTHLHENLTLSIN